MGRKIFIKENQLKTILDLILHEQESPKKEDVTLGTYKLSELFPNNMVKTVSNTSELDKIINNIINDFKLKLSEGYDINDAYILIRSGASSIPATNVLPYGYQPDHNFGVNGFKWITRTENQKNTPSGKIPGAKAIKDGNIYLAKARGEFLKNKILEAFNKIGIKNVIINMETPIVKGSDESDRFVTAEIRGVGRKESPPVKKEPKFIIKLPMYFTDLDNNPMMLVTNTKTKLNPQNKFGQNVENIKKYYETNKGGVPNDILRSVGYIDFGKNNATAFVLYTFVNLPIGFNKRDNTNLIFENKDSFIKAVEYINQYRDNVGSKVYNSGGTLKLSSLDPNALKTSIPDDPKQISGTVVVDYSSGSVHELGENYNQIVPSEGKTKLKLVKYSEDSTVKPTPQPKKL